VCRVEVGNGTRGTGFLVGPDALLTNYHVLRAVIDNPSSAPAVRFRFDYQVLANGVESQGVLASLHPTDWQIDYSPYSDAEAKNKPDEATPTADQLDYALVRLDRPIGDEPLNPAASGNSVRGWIPIPTTAPAITPKMPILILQHPHAEPLKLTFDTEGVLKVYDNGTRVRYATNTESGSSGSPCFDMKWNLVALHHYGDPAFDHPPAYNQGIPINMIRDRVKRQGKDSALGGNSP
jgi:V8-like Glu-specific endopeptidase